MLKPFWMFTIGVIAYQLIIDAWVLVELYWSRLSWFDWRMLGENKALESLNALIATLYTIDAICGELGHFLPTLATTMPEQLWRSILKQQQGRMAICF